MDRLDRVVQERTEAALAALERLCAKDVPQADGCLDEAVGQLIRLRDQLIAERRAGMSCDGLLCRTNAVISLVFGLEFPIAGAQWTRVREARDALNDMLQEPLAATHRRA